MRRRVCLAVLALAVLALPAPAPARAQEAPAPAVVRPLSPDLLSPQPSARALTEAEVRRLRLLRLWRQRHAGQPGVLESAPLTDRVTSEAQKIPDPARKIYPRIAFPGFDVDNSAAIAAELEKDPNPSRLLIDAFNRRAHQKLNCGRDSDAQTSADYGCEDGLLPGSQFLCRPYKGTEFAEVVKLSITIEDPDSPEICSGTLVAPQWVVTAAHCILGKRSTAQVTGAEGRDLDVGLDPARRQVRVIASNAVELAPEDKEIGADRAVVNRFYTGFFRGEPAADLALVHLPRPFPSDRIQPASLPQAGAFDPRVTLAGFGYSNLSPEDTLFRVGWPPLLGRDADSFVFDVSRYASLFCEGDSGGPVFSGIARGCTGADPVGERRPRALEGVMSHFNRSRDPDAPAATDVDVCISAAAMRLQDITTPALHAWLCDRLGPDAGACAP